MKPQSESQIQKEIAERLLCTKDAARFLGIKPQTMERWRNAKDHELPYIKFNQKLIRYRLSDLVAWADRHEVLTVKRHEELTIQALARKWT